MSSLETAPLLPQEIERLFQQASDNVKANLRGTDEECSQMTCIESVPGMLLVSFLQQLWHRSQR